MATVDKAKPGDTPEVPNDVQASVETSESTPNPSGEEFAEQPRVSIGDGPFVKFTDTANYTHKQIDSADFALAGVPDQSGAQWNATNGFLIDVSHFGGEDSKAVKVMLKDPAKEFVLVDADGKEVSK